MLDVMRGNVAHERWRDYLGPFVSLLKEDCTVVGEPPGNISVVDATGIYDLRGLSRIEGPPSIWRW